MGGERIYLMLIAGSSVVLGTAMIYFVRSGLYATLIKWFIPSGVLLIALSSFPIVKAYVDKRLLLRDRLLVLCAGISGLLAGLAAISYGIFPEGSQWGLLLLVFLSVMISQVTLVFAILGIRDFLKKQGNKH